VRLDPPPRGLDLPTPVELYIVEHQHPLRIQLRLVHITHQECAVQAALELDGFVQVGVIPERAGIREIVSVGKRLSGQHGVLLHFGPVHRGRDPETMPVDYGRLGEPVGKPDLQHIPDLRLDRRTGDGAVEGPGSGENARAELPIDLSSLELDRDDSAPRVGLGCSEGAVIGLPPARRGAVRHGPAAFVVVVVVIVSLVRIRVGGRRTLVGAKLGHGYLL
jgi:hypothetical protein